MQHEESSEDNLFRPARVDEARLLSELALQSKAHWGYSSEFLQACRAELSYGEEQLLSERMRFFVLERARRIVGFYALIRQNRTEFELDALFVEPTFIGKGFGHLLVEHAKSVASTMGGTKLIIQGDPNAERFYVAAGGVRTGSKESGSILGRFLPTFSVDLTGNLSHNNAINTDRVSEALLASVRAAQPERYPMKDLESVVPYNSTSEVTYAQS